MTRMTAAIALILSATSAPASAQVGEATSELCTVVLAHASSLMTGAAEKEIVLMFQAYHAARARGTGTDSGAMMAALSKGADQVGKFSDAALGEMTKSCMAGQAKDDVTTLFMLNESMKGEAK